MEEPQGVILRDHKISQAVLKEIAAPRQVAAESVAVRTDPLDAAQEHTGVFRRSHRCGVCGCIHGEPVPGAMHKPSSECRAWAKVGAGSSVTARTSSSEQSPGIVLSGFYSEMVQPFPLQTFGNQTTLWWLVVLVIKF